LDQRAARGSVRCREAPPETLEPAAGSLVVRHRARVGRRQAFARGAFMIKNRFGILLFFLALSIRAPMLVYQRDAYLTGGITTSLGLVARNLLQGKGLVETTGPETILQLYDLQLSEQKLRDIEQFPDPPDSTTSPLIQRMPGYPMLLAVVWR